MMASHKSTLENFDIFITYHETERGKKFAEITKKYLYNEYQLCSFVAHLERKKYSANFDKVRESVIQGCKFFLLINTEDALNRPEVIKEFKLAYPQGQRDNPLLLVLRYDSPEVKLTTPNFEQKTKILLGSINQAPFKDDSDLETVIRNVFDNEEYSPIIDKIGKIRFQDYLRYCVSLVNKINPLDNKSLNELYVPSNAYSTSIEYWDSDENQIWEDRRETWSVEQFLQGKERYTLIAAPFGIGKTSYAKIIAAKLAQNYLEKGNGFIPIYVPLVDSLKNIDEFGNDLEFVLSSISNKEAKILFVFDGLDEYGTEDKISELYDNQIVKRINEYRYCKFILTSRLNSGIPEILKMQKFVRLFSFTDNQVNEFFEKYKIPLKRSDILGTGLSSEDISKPLICWMVALLYNRKDTLKFDNDMKVNKTLLYYEVIHNIIFGKNIHSSRIYPFEKHYVNEKRALRKIAEMKFIYGSSLTISTVKNSIYKFEPDFNMNFQVFNLLVSSYFYVKDTRFDDQRIDFIHKSFIEYLLAEFYLQSFLTKQFSKVNMSTITLETVSFLEGLIYLIKSDSKYESYCRDLVESFGLTFNSNHEIKSQLFELGEICFNDGRVLIPENNGEYPEFEKIVNYLNLRNHRLLGILILNKLNINYKPDQKKFFQLLRSSDTSIIGDIITIENLDLSYSELDKDLANYNLSGAQLSHSTFRGNFFGTKFIGANLSGSTIEYKSNFNGIDFSGADMSGLNTRYPPESVEESEFVAKFNGCHFFNTKFNYADVHDCGFSATNFNQSDISGAKLRSNFIGCYFSNVIFNEETNLSGMTFANDYEMAHLQLTQVSKERTKFLIMDLKEELREKFLSDNPEFKNEIK